MEFRRVDRPGCGYGELPFVLIDAIQIQAPGWAGGPSIGALLESAIGDASPDSPRARHMIVVVDELHWIAVDADVTSNTRAHRREVFASRLPLLAPGGVVRRGSLPLEFASRFEETIVLRPLPEGALRELLRRWPAFVSLTSVCGRLGYTVRVHDEAFSLAARAVTLGRGGATPRTAGAWLVAALRSALIAALDDPHRRELVITPDSLEIPATEPNRPPTTSRPGAPGPGTPRSSLRPGEDKRLCSNVVRDEPRCASWQPLPKRMPSVR